MYIAQHRNIGAWKVKVFIIYPLRIASIESAAAPINHTNKLSSLKEQGKGIPTLIAGKQTHLRPIQQPSTPPSSTLPLIPIPPHCTFVHHIHPWPAILSQLRFQMRNQRCMYPLLLALCPRTLFGPRVLYFSSILRQSGLRECRTMRDEHRLPACAGAVGWGG